MAQAPPNHEIYSAGVGLITTVQRDGVLQVTFHQNRQPNQIQIFAAIADFISMADRKGDVRVIVLKSEARCFHFDRDPLLNRQFIEDSETQLLWTAAHYLIETVSTSTKPIIAAVRGPALGFGVCLAVAADYVVASPTSLFHLPPHAAAHLAGASRGGQARRVHTLSPSEAIHAGIVDSVLLAEDFNAAVRRSADALIDGSRQPFRKSASTRAAGMQRRAAITSSTLAILRAPRSRRRRAAGGKRPVLPVI